jgi:DNA adenine methylase
MKPAPKQLDTPARTCEPLVKWAGGKRLLLKHILPLTTDFGAYFEPFLGGGALFFALSPRTSVLADNNRELVNAYVQVRDHCEEVIAALRKLQNTEGDYYENRRRTPQSKIARAARFIYLTRLSFNGIYRVNLKGDFNVPYGYKTHLSTCDPDQLRQCSLALANADIRCGDFECTAAATRRGDLVYLDPPYTVAHGNNGFLKYNARIFSWADQVRLARVASELMEKGCRVIVSNAHHESILGLYRGFSVRIVERQSVMAASPHARRPIKECVFFSEGRPYVRKR